MSSLIKLSRKIEKDKRKSILLETLTILFERKEDKRKSILLETLKILFERKELSTFLDKSREKSLSTFLDRFDIIKDRFHDSIKVKKNDDSIKVKKNDDSISFSDALRYALDNRYKYREELETLKTNIKDLFY